jgi:catechol 2,3-dioxygenase-like lactoylglutathione lyase family enzyme
MKKRDPSKTLPVSAEDYGRSLKGFGVNLLVSDVARSVAFVTTVLGGQSLYDDEDFAMLELGGSDFMLHADHTFRDNPLSGLVAGLEGRGAGVELRVYGCDPDTAEQKARDGGWTVLAGAIDKPHGLRECILIDDDGYAWVPGVAIGKSPA